MKTFLCVLLVAASSWRCMAVELYQPTIQFVKNLFEDPEIRSDFQGRWKATTWEEYSSERNDPNGGYLFRFQLQFVGSHDTLAFLASDRFGNVRYDAPSWYVYLKMPSGEWREIGKNETLQSGGISVNHPSRTIIQVIPTDRFDPEERNTVFVIRINEDGSVEKMTHWSGQLNEETKKLVEEAVSIVPQFEKIPLAAFLRSPQTKWRQLGEHGMAAQSLDPEDAPLLASNKDLEWGQAVDLANSLVDNSFRALEPEKQRTHAPFELLPPAPEPKKPTEQEPVRSTPSERPTSLTSWTIVALGVAAVLGLLWVLFKNRK